METTPKPAEAPKTKSNTWKLIAIVVVILIVVGVAAYILTQKTTTSANVILQDDGVCQTVPPDVNCLFNPASYNATVNGNLPTISSPDIGIHGGTYSFSFTTAGTYHYYCSIHPWMKGVVVAK